jgi:hypothetical protein
MALLTACGGGGGGGSSPPPPPPPPDTTPNAFTFSNQSDTALSTNVSSNEIAITGINAAAPISITGGEYSIEGGAFTAAAGTISNNQHVRVRLASSGQFSTGMSAVLTVGGVAATFTATTLAADTTPDAFQFARKADAPRDTWATSAGATITGINTQTPVVVVNGEYSIDNGAFTSAAGNVNANQTITVRVMAGATYSKVTRVQLTVGNVTGSFEVTSELPKYIPDSLVFDGDDILYLQSNANKQVYRWSLSGACYLDAYPVGSGANSPTAMTFSSAHHRLYLGYSTGEIRYFDVQAAAPAETALVTMTEGVTSLGSAGKFLLAQTGNYYYGGGFVLDDTGATKDNGGYYYGYSRETAWDPVTSRVYYFRDGLSPNDLQFDVINQASGEVTSQGETPYHGAYNILGPIRVSNDGAFVLLGSGDIYSQAALNWSGSLGAQIADARWLANGSLVAITTANNQTTLRRTGTNNAGTQEQLNYAGTGLRVFGKDDRMAVALVKDSTVQFQVYVPNDDSDGDGVANTQDAFPLDPAASVDSDHDGYPDAWNSGRSASDSTTGLALDVFPQDSACWLQSHANGSACNYAATMPDFLPDQVVQGGNIVYLLSSANKRVYRWSITTAEYLNPYVVGIDQGFSTTAPVHIAYSAEHQRLYLGYETGAIQYIGLASATPAEVPFANTAMAVRGLACVGQYLLAQDSSGAWATHYIFTSTGALTDQKEWNYYSREYAWDPVSSRVYFFRDDTSPDDLQFEVIDQGTGKITGQGETPYHGDYSIQTPIRVSPDGEKVLLGSGDIYERATLARTGSLNTSFADARWFANGSLAMLVTDGTHSVLRRLGSNGQSVLEQLSYDGEALRVLGGDTRMALLFKVGATVQFRVYLPSDDTDGDGVLNPQDAFPADPAASTDTDHDGHPDAWNAGKGPSDSNSGLTLDSYPQDSACWLPAHGSGGNCNAAATVPAYVPDAVAQQGDVIYLLSKANARVYRWSISGNKYLNPYIVGIDQGIGTIAPLLMTYSSAHQRLYFGYATGAIRSIGVNTSNPVEAPFATTAMSVLGLGSVGNFVLAQDQSSPWGKRYVFSSTGATAFSMDSYSYDLYNPTEFIWDPVNSRAFTASPYYLRYDVVDQTSGAITSSGASAYTGTYDVGPPIRVSVNGQYVLIGNGDVFDQSNALAWAGSLGTRVTDAHWFANGSLAVLSDTGGATLLRRLGSPNQVVLEQLSYNGIPLAIVGSDAALVVLTNDGGTVQFHPYVPSDDTDGDGVLNTQDAFPLDPAASVDTDRDGFPDAWNAGKSQADSTTNLTLDAYPQDSACWLPAHGDGVTCNYGAAMPDYVPDAVTQRGDVVYLLSNANRRVYRWSIATGKYLNPYVVGLDLGYVTLAPVSITYHPAQQRLYLGYSNGAIRYIDVNAGTPVEVAFFNAQAKVDDLTPVGNLLFANAGDGYMFNSSAVVLDHSAYWGDGDSAWDPITSRLYTARAGGYYGLEYREINATTGKFGGQYSPYYSSNSVAPPLRVSPDGELVLVGTGLLYGQTGPGHVGALGKSIKDAQWVDNLLVDVDSTDLVEIRNANSRAVIHSYQYTSAQPLRVLFGTSEAYLMHVVNNTTAFVRLAFYDQDNDQIDRWFEQRYGMSDTNSANATQDPDGDGVNTRVEFQNLSNPLVADTDGDGLGDGQEINTYLTDPTRADSDGDGLNDHDEVITHGSDPWDTDSDDDGYDDLVEVLQGGDPTDSSGLPQPLTSFTQSFEGSPNLAAWSPGALSNGPWVLDSTTARTGSASLKSGVVASNQMSSVRLKGYFRPGTLTFYQRIDGSYGCCEQLAVYVDGNYVSASYNTSGAWMQNQLTLTLGVHEIEWRYLRDNNDGLNEAAWIDDVSFTGQ